MSTSTKSIEKLLQELSPDMQAEVRDFIEFLLAKQERRSGKTLRQGWAGALRDHREEYTSLELERRAIGWRED
ncbi:MAG: DUF2281 domain-containing protein [Anaerolineae bacterium]